MFTKMLRLGRSMQLLALCTLFSTLTIPVTAAETIVPDDYNYSLEIKFDGYTGTTTLTNFPALIELADGLQGFSYNNMASDTYADLRFTTDDRTTTIPFEVEEWGTQPAIIDPATLQGCLLWLQADVGVETDEEGGLIKWNDQSGNNNHATSQSASHRPELIPDTINGLPIVHFDGHGDNYINFPRLTTIRTVFWVIKEVPEASNERFLLGDSTAYNFHRGTGRQIWNSSHAPLMFNGTTELNGNKINGTSTSAPTDMSVLSVRTTGNASASSLSRDRNITTRSWHGDLAELIIYDRVLTQKEVDSVYAYLEDKYAISISYTLPPSRIWVQVPELTANTSIFAHWGNPAATDIPTYTTDGTVWNEDYAAVYHLSEHNGFGKDSTDNARHGTPKNNLKAAQGVISSATWFNGQDAWIGLPTNFGLFKNQPVTISLWLNAALMDNNMRVPFSGFGENNLFLTFGDSLPDNTIGIRINDGAWKTPVSTADLQINRWYHIAVTWDPVDGYRMYADGIQSSTSSLITDRGGSSANNCLGSLNGSQRHFKGALDEVRVSSVVRSPDWIKACNDNQASPAAFATYLSRRYYDTTTDSGLQSGDGIWDATTSLWSYTLDGDDPLQTWSPGSLAYFEANGNSVITVDNVIAEQIIFNGTGYQLDSGSIALQNGGIIANQSAAINSTITMQYPQAWTAAAEKTLAINGQVNNNSHNLGIDGAGTITLTGVISGSGALSKNGNGTVTLDALNTYTGGTTVNAGTMVLSKGGGTGTIRGTLDVAADAEVKLVAGNALGYTTGNKINTLNINGGLVNNTATGDNGWGLTINMTGGELRSNNGVSSSTTDQLYALGGGSAINTLAGTGTASISGRINLRNGNTDNTLVVTVADGAAPIDLEISAAITESQNSGIIAKQGSGVMSVTGDNTYSGGTIIYNGTLLANNTTGVATGTGTTTINGGILGGGGAVASLAFGPNGGELAPGNNGVGTLTVKGDLTLSPIGWLNLDFSGSSAYDSLIVTGDIDLNNARLTGNFDSPPDAAAKYFIIINQGNTPVTGTLAGALQDGTIDINGYTFKISYTGDSTSNAITGGNDVVLYDAMVTPPPAGPFWKKISFPGYYHHVALTNFPALIAFNEQMRDFSYTTFLSPTGSDLRFYTDQSKSMELNYEIEEWNTSGTSYVWVQLSELTKDTAIWACWGDPNKSTAPTYTSDGSTWSEEYAAVWHLNEESGNNADATANLHHGTPYNNTRTEGIIGGAQYFDGSNYIQIPYSPTLNPESFSISFWAKRESGTAHAAVISARNEPPQAGYIVYSQGGNWSLWTGTTGWHQEPKASHTLNTWDYITATFDGTTKRIYKNGDFVAQSTPASFNINPANNLRIGAGKNETAPDYFFTGTIDELRIASVVRPPEWHWASYQNQRDPLKFTGETPASYWDISAAKGLQSGNGTWSTSANYWSDNPTGSSPLLAWNTTAAPDAWFTAPGGGAVNVAETLNVGRTYFESSGYTLTGSQLKLDAGIDALDSVNVNTPVELQTSQRWSVAAGKTAKFNGTITGGTSARIFKTGAGTLDLNAHNSFSGGVTVNEGKLVISLGSWAANPAQGSGKLVVNPGSIAEFYGAHSFGGGSGGRAAHINRGELYFANENYITTIELTAGRLYGNNETRTVSGHNFIIYTADQPSIIDNNTSLYNDRTITLEGGAAEKDLIINGIISNSNKLTIDGPGTVELTANSTYSGGTEFINGATLLVNNTTGSGTGSGDLSINNGTLGGTGTIAGAVSFGGSGGTIAPGDSVGTLTVNNDVTFSSNASLDITINGITTAEYSNLVVDGAVALAGAALNLTVDTEIVGAKSFVIIRNNSSDPTTGTFEDLPEGATLKVNGASFTIHYSADADAGTTTGGNDVLLRSIPGGTLIIVR